MLNETYLSIAFAGALYHRPAPADYLQLPWKEKIIMHSSLGTKITTGSLLRFAFPTIISMIFMGFYTTVDGMFVSRLVGTNALSAVNIMFPLITAALAVGTMLGAGGSAVVAKKMGEGKSQEARKNFSLLAIVSLVIGIALSAVSFLFLNPMIHFLGADDTLFVFCRDYAVPTLILLPAMLVSMMLQPFFIAAGKAPLGLVLSILGGVTNIVLDYVFIAIFGWGIAGAAAATGIGYTLTGILGILYFLLARKGSIYFVRPSLDFAVILKTCTNGSSEMITNLATGLTTLLMNNILMSMIGPDGVASITIILYAYTLLSSAYIGYSMGIAPIISYNYGKKDTDQLKKVYKISIRMILAASIATFIFSLLLSSLLVSIFTPKGTVVYNMAVEGFRMFSVCFLFMGFNVYSSAMFTALSNGMVSAIISFLRTLVFVVAASLLLPYLIGLNGVWLAIPVAELLGLGVTIYYFKTKKSYYHYA